MSWLKEVLHYDPETGIFTWLKGNKRTVLAGHKAGHKNKVGYIQIKFKNKIYLAHRLAWFYMTGEWPKQLIDHKDTNPSNNAWNNLREASRRENAFNRNVSSNNKLGVKGIHVYKDKYYYAQITINGKSKYLGLFKTLNEAKMVYDRAAFEIYQEFAR